MRIASILAATAAIGWLAYTVWDLPVPRPLHWYLGWLGVITLTAVFVAQRIPQNEHSYAIFYAVMLGPLVVCVLALALQFGLSLGDDGLMGFGLFVFVALYFVGLFRRYTPDEFVTKVMLTQGFVFLVSGLLTLASVIPPCSTLQLRLRLILGLYWLSVAAYSFCQTLGIVRSRALFESLSTWFASAMCVVFLGGLALWLHGIHRELGRQHSTDEQVVELIWEASE